MDDVEEGAPALVPGAHRVIRRLDAEESAFAGDLVSDGDRQRVRAPASAVDPVLWEFAGAEHVAGVRDVVRARDGHDALLPWCADAVDVLLARRASAEDPLTAGEVVTLVGSMLRGIVEIAERDLRGRWWLDDAARPVFVPGEGAACAPAAAGIIDRLRQDRADRALDRVLEQIAAQAGDHRLVARHLDEWERTLTELAAPRPLNRDVHAPERVRAIPLHRERMREPQDAGERPALRERVAGLRMRVAASVLALRERWRDRTPRRPGHVREDGESGARPPRGRMLLVGAAAAGAVLVGGLLWPGGDDSSATERVPAGIETNAPEETPAAAGATAAPATGEAVSEQPEPDAGGETHADEPAAGTPEHSATLLLKRIDACRAEEDAECADAVVAGSGAAARERLGPDSARRAVTLIEDYGDIAVIRLAPDDGHSEQMLVIVRQNDGWLVRDVYDVADQPSGKG